MENSLKEMAIVKAKNISAYYLPWFSRDFMGYNLFLDLCQLEFYACGASFSVSLMPSFILSQYRDSHARNLVFPIPIFLL